MGHVEILPHNGTWVMLRSCHTMEHGSCLDPVTQWNMGHTEILSHNGTRVMLRSCHTMEEWWCWMLSHDRTRRATKETSLTRRGCRRGGLGWTGHCHSPGIGGDSRGIGRRGSSQGGGGASGRSAGLRPPGAGHLLGGGESGSPRVLGRGLLAPQGHTPGVSGARRGAHAAVANVQQALFGLGLKDKKTMVKGKAGFCRVLTTKCR